MAFTPLARVRNFSEKYLSEFINLYPNIMYDSAWCDAADSIDQEMKGYKRTYYQQACQLGIEDRSDDKKFQYHVYLEMFDSENLKKYMEFWFKIYYAPNPYVKGDENDLPVLLYCEFAKKILESSTLSIHFKEVDIQICGTDASGDILLNCFKSYGAPIKFRKNEETKDSKADGILFVELGDKKRLQELVRFIEREFPIPNDNNKKAFYDRFSYDNFNKFWAVTGQPYNKRCEVVKDPRIEFYRNESNRIQGGENIVL